jgi:hypothetical protein
VPRYQRPPLTQARASAPAAPAPLQACTPEGLARQLLRLQALRSAAAASCSLRPPAAGEPDAGHEAAQRGAACDCLSELCPAAPPRGAAPPPHLAEGEAAWRAAGALGLEGAWSARGGEAAAALLRARLWKLWEDGALRVVRRSTSGAAALRAAGGAMTGALHSFGELARLNGLQARLEATGFGADRALHSARAWAAGRLSILLPRDAEAAAREAAKLLRERPALAAPAAAAAARRAAALLLQAGVVADAAAQGPWCALAAEYHRQLAALEEWRLEEGDDRQLAERGGLSRPQDA